MIRPELRELDCPELDDEALKEYAPSDPGCVALRVDAFIGERGKAGEDIFYFLVRTPQYLADELATGEYRFGRNYLILPRYSYGLLWEAISDLCEGIEGPDWETVAGRLGRYGLWEYDTFYGPRLPLGQRVS